MKTKITAIATIIISALLLSSCAGEYFTPASHETRNYYEVDGIYYGIEENSFFAAVSGYDEKRGSHLITIPEEVTISGKIYLVTEIEDFAFSGTDLENLILPPSILAIGRYAFYNSALIKSITLSGSVCPSCSNSAFNTDSYKTVTINHPATMVLQSPFDRFKNTRQY